MATLAEEHPLEEEWWVALGAAAAMIPYLAPDDAAALSEALLRASTGSMTWLPLYSVTGIPDKLVWEIPRNSCWECCWMMLVRARYESNRTRPDPLRKGALLEEAWRTCPSETVSSVLKAALVSPDNAPSMDDIIAQTAGEIAGDLGLVEE